MTLRVSLQNNKMNKSSYWLGKKLSSEHRKKLSIAHSKLIGKLNPLWRGGDEAKNARRKAWDSLKAFICADCTAPFKGKEGCNSKYCPPCRSVICICSYCQKDFSIKRKDFNDGRGLFCSLLCYRTHLALFPIVGSKHHSWTGGLSPSTTRRARLYKAEGNHTKLEWETLKRGYNYMCLCCKQQEPFVKLSEDHIVPLVMGGSNDISNIQPLCLPCNMRKHTKTIDFTKLYAKNK